MFEHVSHLVGFVPILPLIGAILNGFYSFSGAKLVRPIVHWIACGSLFLSFVITAATFFHFLSLPTESREVTVTFFNWITTSTFWVDVAFLVDPLSLTMMLVVTGVGFLIHVYSIGYMAHDDGYARYFSYLNLFCFAMLLLVMGSNLLMFFIGWEGVGLCSYLLIGFWFADKEKAVAGMKAFIVNRIGDFGFIVGVLLLFWSLYEVGFPTMNFTELREAAPLLAGKFWLGVPAVTLITLFFFVGATGKSAQIPLYVWLPDAMAGPTPVSALIHAATMVTAGVYMIARLNFLYSMSAFTLNVVAVVGFLTAAFAATIAFAQNDIKKVLAYSTISQLGFMFGAMGVGAYSAGIFHLVTHAFFKACLFLGSGSVIHALSGEQDMRRMGGLKHHLPITFMTFFVATLAIAGIFPFAGFFSKDEILWQTFNRIPALWVVGVVAALGTAIYMFRLATLTFYGKLRLEGEARHHIHESPLSMTFVLVTLAILSVVGGLLGFPDALGHLFGLHESNLIHHWLSEVMPEPTMVPESLPHSVEYGLMIFSFAVAAFGCYLGFNFYTRRVDIPQRIVASYPRFYKLVSNKFYVDELYFAVVVRSLMWLKDFLGRFDLVVIDGLVNLSALGTKLTSFASGWFDRTFVDGAVNSVADGTFLGSAGSRRIQTGQIQSYLYYALGAVVVILLYRLF
ncbi:MAG: NADH-quinone oxidoreductase subunit L [Deltaproteobacteria bacterium]|nr:NADH-quinone oxidoreductase subunit L [Deltaproteobacteria bacterium]